MIPMAPGGGAPGTAAFPEPPKGDPGAISGVARTLHGAADDLEHTEGGMRTATSTLAYDWQGYAADAYQRSSTALGSVARGAAETFRECATAVSSYGSALETAQSEIKRLKHMYDDAIRRQQAAANLAGRLESSITPTTKPAAATKLTTQAGNASQQSTDAGTEADGYAKRATTILNEFKQSASRYEATLNGVQPGERPGIFGPAVTGLGQPGPGFGIPYFSNTFGPGMNPGPAGLQNGGLNQYSGVIPVGSTDPYKSPIPGYPTFYDGEHQGLTSPGDLTNVIAFVASFGAAGLAKDAGESGLSFLARQLGIGAGGKGAVDDAIAQAERQYGRGLARVLRDENGDPVLDANGKPELGPGRSMAKRLAAINKEDGQYQTKVGLADQAVGGAQQAGVLPLPPGARELVTHVLQNKVVFTAAVAVKLVTAREALIEAGTPAALKTAKAIDGILKVVLR